MSENPILKGVNTALSEYSRIWTPVTQMLSIVIGIVFIGEMLGAIFTTAGNVRIFSTGIFGVYPWVAWPLSPVLHKGIKHFLSSIVLILIIGIPVENHWQWKEYSLFIVVTGYVTIGGGAALLWLFSDQQLAFYGSSGIVYALAGYSLTHLPREHDSLTLPEKIAVLIGLASLLSVVVDLFTGPLFTAH